MDKPVEWQIYERIADTLKVGETVEALRLIGASHEATRNIAGDIARIEAECYEAQGDHDRALHILEHAAINYPQNYWVHHRIARMYQSLGQSDSCIRAYRKAHSVRGWEESERNGYIFLHDYFSANIPCWSEWFAEKIVAKPINAIEIGSWQGGSATWLLDKVVSRRGGRLTCIDTFEGSSEHAAWIGSITGGIESIFDKNIVASGYSSLCRKIKGHSQDILRALYQERFDFIYIDGAHEARYVIEDAVLAFGLLNHGGFLCFDDYDFTFATNPRQNTNRAVDIFLDLYTEEISFVGKGRQVLLQKRIPSGVQRPVEHE